MSHTDGFGRRAFLKNAGLTALAGAVGAGSSIEHAAAAVLEPANGKYDFDTVFDRVGSECVKWDQQIKKYGKENIQVGMGIADMDFRAAPCITRAIQERCKHENWGYLDTPVQSYIDAIVSWNKKRYGLAIDSDTVVLSNGVHPGIIAALRSAASPQQTRSITPILLSPLRVWQESTRVPVGGHPFVRHPKCAPSL